MLALMLQHEDSRMGQNSWNKEKCNSVKSKKSTLPYINADCIVLANIVQAYMNMQSHFWGWSPNNDQWLLVLTKKTGKCRKFSLSHPIRLKTSLVIWFLKGVKSGTKSTTFTLFNLNYIKTQIATKSTKGKNCSPVCQSDTNILCQRQEAHH